MVYDEQLLRRDQLMYQLLSAIINVSLPLSGQ